eukprot:PhF_6_TR37864/c0_g1_i1/m.56433
MRSASSLWQILRDAVFKKHLLGSSSHSQNRRPSLSHIVQQQQQSNANSETHATLRMCPLPEFRIGELMTLPEQEIQSIVQLHFNSSCNPSLRSPGLMSLFHLESTERLIVSCFWYVVTQRFRKDTCVKYKEALFASMALYYSTTLNHIVQVFPSLHIRMFAECSAHVLHTALNTCFAYDRGSFDNAFQEELLRSVVLWFCGVVIPGLDCRQWHQESAERRYPPNAFEKSCIAFQQWEVTPIHANMVGDSSVDHHHHLTASASDGATIPPTSPTGFNETFSSAVSNTTQQQQQHQQQPAIKRLLTRRAHQQAQSGRVGDGNNKIRKVTLEDVVAGLSTLDDYEHEDETKQQKTTTQSKNNNNNKKGGKVASPINRKNKEVKRFVSVGQAMVSPNSTLKYKKAPSVQRIHSDREMMDGEDNKDKSAEFNANDDDPRSATFMLRGNSPLIRYFIDRVKKNTSVAHKSLIGAHMLMADSFRNLRVTASHRALAATNAYASYAITHAPDIFHSESVTVPKCSNSLHDMLWVPLAQSHVLKKKSKTECFQCYTKIETKFRNIFECIQCDEIICPVCAGKRRKEHGKKNLKKSDHINWHSKARQLFGVYASTLQQPYSRTNAAFLESNPFSLKNAEVMSSNDGDDDGPSLTYEETVTIDAMGSPRKGNFNSSNPIRVDLSQYNPVKQPAPTDVPTSPNSKRLRFYSEAVRRVENERAEVHSLENAVLTKAFGKMNHSRPASAEPNVKGKPVNPKKSIDEKDSRSGSVSQLSFRSSFGPEYSQADAELQKRAKSTTTATGTTTTASQRPTSSTSIRSTVSRPHSAATISKVNVGPGDTPLDPTSVWNGKAQHFESSAQGHTRLCRTTQFSTLKWSQQKDTEQDGHSVIADRTKDVMEKVNEILQQLKLEREEGNVVRRVQQDSNTRFQIRLFAAKERDITRLHSTQTKEMEDALEIVSRDMHQLNIAVETLAKIDATKTVLKSIEATWIYALPTDIRDMLHEYSVEKRSLMRRLISEYKMAVPPENRPPGLENKDRTSIMYNAEKARATKLWSKARERMLNRGVPAQQQDLGSMNLGHSIRDTFSVRDTFCSTFVGGIGTCSLSPPKRMFRGEYFVRRDLAEEKDPRVEDIVESFNAQSPPPPTTKTGKSSSISSSPQQQTQQQALQFYVPPGKEVRTLEGLTVVGSHAFWTSTGKPIGTLAEELLHSRRRKLLSHRVTV